jgi:hypothetical protein
MDRHLVGWSHNLSNTTSTLNKPYRFSFFTGS